MEVLEAVLLGPFIVCFNNIKHIMKSLFKALMLLVVVITVTSCGPSSSSSSDEGDFRVEDQFNVFYTNQVTLEDNSAKFTTVDNIKVIINGDFTITENKCSSCEEAEKE